MPPPPAVLLSITGKPIRVASRAGLRDVGKQSASGEKRQPMLLRERTGAMLQPEVAHLRRRQRPMNAMPLASQASAKAAFSLRNP